MGNKGSEKQQMKPMGNKDGKKQQRTGYNPSARKNNNEASFYFDGNGNPNLPVVSTHPGFDEGRLISKDAILKHIAAVQASNDADLTKA